VSGDRLLRRPPAGELMALDWENIDLGMGKNTGTITIERSFDPKTGVYVAPKSRAGTRRVPIATVLRERLIEHRLRTGRASGLVFGPDGKRPLSCTATLDRARRAWASTCPCGRVVENHNGDSCQRVQVLEQSGSTKPVTHSPRS
jgi:integrase